MVKPKTFFACQQCGAEFPKWLGRCSECGSWNSLVETPQFLIRRTGPQRLPPALEPQKLSQVKSVKRFRLTTNIPEFDRVLGGGVVPGSLVLLAGPPGIGKSTLMLQLATKIKNSVLYVSGEESLQQIKIRAERLGAKNDQLLLLTETDVDLIVSQFAKKEVKFSFVVIDSIQTLTTTDLSGASGSVGQVRECATRLQKLAKSSGIAVFLIGHVTKEGAIAGPKVLEHLVDTVVYFEGDKFGEVRLLRASKNRFGPTDEVGIFEMGDQGLMAVSNPSKLFLKKRNQGVPGSVVAATIEGTRPVLVEIQALVVPTQLSIPRRIAQGVDYRRLQLISAVLTKRLGLPLAGFDIYVNITGGFKIEEPAVDLAVALAIVSSFRNKALNAKLVCFGEIGLLGEIRQVGQSATREKEARRLGFTTIISPDKHRSIGQAARQVIK